ncbi:MAG TPA: acetoacetate decarboxylase family protein, partial [Smithellaceae bacterium]|nr:acetoacetate decarboxylase family protein [Smithellaceae bacterium]
AKGGSMKKGDLFKGVMQWEMMTKDLSLEGRMPTFYYDNTAMTAIYTASTDQVRKLLPLSVMHPVEAWPGRALVAFTAFEYRKTDIDPYNEFSISFPITYEKTSLAGITMIYMMLKRYFTAYVWQLPVTTERARRGGVDMFGYPKFIADISFSREKDALACTLSESGKEILVLKGQKLQTVPEKVNRFKTYSIKDGVPLVANIYMNPVEFGKSMSGKSAQLSLGNHDIAKKLRDINLSPKPIFFEYMPVMEAILYGPRNLMDD